MKRGECVDCMDDILCCSTHADESVSDRNWGPTPPTAHGTGGESAARA